MKKILYTKQFLRAFKKLPRNIQRTYRKREKLFLKNIFDKKLKTHKLQSSNYYSFSITHKNRVIFLKNNNLSQYRRPFTLSECIRRIQFSISNI